MDEENVVYTLKYYSASKRKEILSYATTWMKFEDKQNKPITKRQIKDMILPTWGI